MGIRTERVAKLLQREVADILTTELSQELQAMVTVTGVRVTKDLSIAYVHVSVLADSLPQRQTAFVRVEALAPQIRQALAARIRHQMKSVPELRFFLDESLQEAQRMEDLFDRIRAERARRESE